MEILLTAIVILQKNDLWHLLGCWGHFFQNIKKVTKTVFHPVLGCKMANFFQTFSPIQQIWKNIEKHRTAYLKTVLLL